MDVVNCSIVVVSEQQSIRPGAENSAGPSGDLAVEQKAGNELLRLTAGCVEADHAITRTNFGVTGAVQRDEK